ncbi:MAG TPA: carbohydrate binding domain-containing protein [Tepidiformaceae bacterium]|nr:carbohydrate binding domain-containing protein [Tepidiformaceae bacterium]
MIDALSRNLFDFGRPVARRNAFLLLIVAALVSWDIDMPRTLPAVRLEQLALAALLPSIALYVLRTPAVRRPHFVDYAFLALAITTLVSIIFAPVLVSKVTWSIRDPFEIARIVEYWLLFRLGLSLEPSEENVLVTLKVLIVAILANTLFSLVQYLHPGDFNGTVTAIWTIDHNLEGVELTGRVVGTAGNANYYGIFSGFFLALALGLLMLRHRLAGVWHWLTLAAIAASTLSIIMAQSRTAVAATLGAFGLALVFVIVRRRGRAAYTLPIGLFLASVVLSVTFVQLVPPRFESFADRFSPGGLTSDSSFTTRLSRWKSLFAGFLEDDSALCDGSGLEDTTPQLSHIPDGTTGAPAASADAIARDDIRKQDIHALSAAVVDYYCDNSAWPADLPLAEALVPSYLPELPTDPQTGDDYLAYVAPEGFTVGARLENLADPDGPIYGLGTTPNMILNSSFEHGGASWLTTYTASLSTGGEAPLFGDGEMSALLTYPTDGRPPGSLYQRVIFAFPQDTDYTVTVWARTPTGVEQSVQVYVNALTTAGDLEEGLAKRVLPVPADGSWARLDLTFKTPDDVRLNEMQVAFLNPTADGLNPVFFDGVTIQQGTFAPHFELIRDVDPARLRPSDLPVFADSPIIGTGPGNSLVQRGLDNEYFVFLDRYGVLGTIAYVWLYVVGVVVSWKAWRQREDSLVNALALAMLTFSIALIVFNIAAGSFYHFQIMAVYWSLAGLLGAAALAVKRPSPAP